jgi:hypothetical protein
VLSRPFFSNLYNRSDAIAKREVKRLESMSRFTPPENDPPSQ